MLRPIKDHQSVVDQQSYPETNVTKASDSWLIPEDCEMVQRIRPINKLRLKDIFSLWREEYEFKYAHKKLCIIYSSQ